MKYDFSRELGNIYIENFTSDSTHYSLRTSARIVCQIGAFHWRSFKTSVSILFYERGTKSTLLLGIFTQYAKENRNTFSKLTLSIFPFEKLSMTAWKSAVYKFANRNTRSCNFTTDIKTGHEKHATNSKGNLNTQFQWWNYQSSCPDILSWKLTIILEVFSSPLKRDRSVRHGQMKPSACIWHALALD